MKLSKLRILVGCETSGAIRQRARANGHDCWSCDVLPADDDTDHHLQCDVEEALHSRRWDMVIMHLPCTYFTNAGVRWLFAAGRSNGEELTPENRNEERWQAMKSDEARWLRCQAADVPMMLFENPVPHGYVDLGQWASQITQPWYHGSPKFKATKLWRKGLDELRDTNRLVPPKRGTDEYKSWSEVHRAAPGPLRWKIRSKTDPGIADAIVAQYCP